MKRHEQRHRSARKQIIIIFYGASGQIKRQNGKTRHLWRVFLDSCDDEGGLAPAFPKAINVQYGLMRQKVNQLLIVAIVMR